MWFRVIGQPQGKGRPRFTKSGHVYTPDKTREYEELIAIKCREACKDEPIQGACAIWVTAVFGVPDSFGKRKKADALDGLIKPTVKPDADNILKAVMDALNGIAFTDDKQVVRALCEKQYGEVPMIEVHVNEVKHG